MEITNAVREYAAKGMDEMSEKFKTEGSALYKEDYAEGQAARDSFTSAPPE